MDDCIVKIRQLMDQLSDAEKRVAQHLIQTPSEIIGMPIGQLAGECDTSSTTVVRLCKKLQYKGYKELSAALSTDLVNGGHARIHFEDVSPDDDLETIIANTTDHNQRAISDTVRLLDPEVYARAIDVIVAAPRIDFYGVGASGLVALDAQQKFLRIGKATQASIDSHVQVVTAATLQKGDAAVLFSYSGETTDTLDTLHEIQKTGATTLSVTRYGNSRLSRLTDIQLYIATTEMLVRSAAMSSRMAMMHVVDLLFTGAATKAYAQYKPMLDMTHLAGKEKRAAQRERRK